ncbi:hypothetical protein ACFVP8_04115 [Viridibacillus arvi]|uniref:DUF6414 family protein n=1 Tax=Viridibacillus arvi TaxID=263475 RepID=UPI00368EF57A
MKEIIYLDTNIMNSMLAQLDQGIVNSFSLENSDQEEVTESSNSTSGLKAAVEAGVKLSTGILPGGSVTLKGNGGGNKTESEGVSKTFSEGQKDILNKAFHDYALEVLFGKLEEQGLLIRGNDYREGDLFTEVNGFRFYDFDLIQKAMDLEIWQTIMGLTIPNRGISYEQALKILNKTKHTAKEREQIEIATLTVEEHENMTEMTKLIKDFNKLGSLSSNLLNDLSVIKVENKIGLIKKEFLRESAEALSFRTDDKRKAKMLMRVIGVKQNVYSGEEAFTFFEQDIDTIPNLMLDIVLGSFKIINSGDLLVTPIAIYYE